MIFLVFKIACCAGISDYKNVCELGFDYIELAGREIASLSEPQFMELLNNINNSSISCIGFNSLLPADIMISGNAYNPKKNVSYLSLILNRGKILGVKGVGYGSPMSRIIGPNDNARLGFEQNVDFIHTGAEIAQRLGIFFNIEALNSTECNFMNTIPEAIKILKEVNHPGAGLVVDLYHMDMNDEDIQVLDMAAPWIRHVHIAEKHKRQHLLFERYDHYKKSIEKVISCGYNGPISIEATFGELTRDGARSVEILRRISNEIS